MALGFGAQGLGSRATFMFGLLGCCFSAQKGP